jgi:GNAT superfamily N-acetyltransferase
MAPEMLELRGVAYRLEILRGSELAPLISLFHDAFGGRRFDLDSLRRKYACEHGGVSGFACVAFDDNGEAAGAVGVLPWPVRLGDRVETAGQMVDVSTHSAHRGRGLFVALADHARDVCDTAGIAFLYGFPNQEAYPIWIHKLGYEHTHDLVEYRLPVRTIWVEKPSHRVGPLGWLYERYARRVLAARELEEPRLENSLGHDGFACVDRNPSFHAYKAAVGGAKVLQVEGGRAWVKPRHGLLVGDLEASSESDLDRTTRALRGLAIRLGLHEIVLQASEDTRFATYFSRRFEPSRKLPVIYRDIRSEIPKDRLRFTLGDLDNF